MAAKVDEKVFARIIELREKYGLSQDVIAQRLGLSLRTVSTYLRAARLGITQPYAEKNRVSS